MIGQREAIHEAILDAAREICLAAVTAPKACGRDSVVTAVLTGEEILRLADRMDKIESERNMEKRIFERDAELVRACDAVVLIGCTREPRRLKPCSLCGFANCGEALKAGAHCIFDDIDLGIALGSAASIAADLRADNRILYTAGMAALQLGFLDAKADTVMALPLSAHARNQFFLR